VIRLNIRLLAGVATLVATAGAWMLGKRTGAKIAKMTDSPGRAPTPPEDVREESVDAEEVPPR
jgi:hypothetical protein